MRWIVTLLCLLAGLVWSAASPAAKLVRIEVLGPRLSLADVLPSRPGLQRVDLGAAPAARGTRVVTRADMLSALARAPDPPAVSAAELPDAVRFVRKMQSLSVADVERLLRAALSGRLPAATTLTRVKARRAQVPAGWQSVRATLPKRPRRPGAWTTTASLRYFSGDVEVARLLVPVELSLTTAAKPDLARGAAVVLVVRRGRVVVRARGIAGTDADVGDVFPVRLRTSGKVLRAELVSPEEAVVVEGSR